MMSSITEVVPTYSLRLVRKAKVGRDAANTALPMRPSLRKPNHSST